MKSRAWFRIFLPHPLKSVALGKYPSLDFLVCKMRNWYLFSAAQSYAEAQTTPQESPLQGIKFCVAAKNLLSLSSSQNVSVLFRRPKTVIALCS